MLIVSSLKRMAHGVVALVVGANAVGAAETKTAKPFAPDFESVAPLPIVATAAGNHGVALAGFYPGTLNPAALQPGDQVTALVSLLEANDVTQWLIEVTCVELNATEKQKPPLRTWTFHSNAGTEIFLSATRAALALRVLGPFQRKSRERDAAKESLGQSARVMVNADFLSLGLNRACAAVMAVNAAKENDPTLQGLNWSIRQKPFPAEETSKLRAVADSLGLTPERERALAGAVPALQEFFRIISQTPGLQDILKRVVDVPWWKVIKSGGDAPIGIMPQFRLAEEFLADTPFRGNTDGPIYTVPFLLSIAGQPALVGKLAVADPQGPLLACAGVLAVSASAPNGKGPRVMLELVSTETANSEARATNSK